MRELSLWDSVSFISLPFSPRHKVLHLLFLPCYSNALIAFIHMFFGLSLDSILSFWMMHHINSLFLHIPLLLACCGTIKTTEPHLFDFNLTSDMKGSDTNNPSSTLSKLIKFIVKGQHNLPGDYLSIDSKEKNVELGIEIKDSSVFCPGNKTENCQHGFRYVNRFLFCFFLRKNSVLDGLMIFIDGLMFYQLLIIPRVLMESLSFTR